MAMPFSMRSNKYKRGIIEPLTAGLLTAVMISVAITVFVWGEPFLRKSEAISVLEN